MIGESQQKNIIMRIQVQEKDKGGLYLGNIWAAEEVGETNTDNIKAVLTVASNTQIKYKPGTVIHKIIEADDNPNFDLSINFEEGVKFIQKQLQSSHVLVHCFAGVSRSATIVIAYLMKYHKMTLNQALQLTTNQRPVVGPNDGFIKQLKKYEQKLKQK